MTNNFMNNPMLDMFKKTFENPMDMFGKNAGMGKSFDPSQWMEMSSKMIKDIPWLKEFGTHSDYDKVTEIFSDLKHLSLENTQAMMYRQAEIIQKHSTELQKFMRSMSPVKDPETNMETQKEFMQASFESMINDFKELAEMYSKSNLETFGAVSDKMSQHMKCQTKTKDSCSAHHTKPKSKPSSAKASRSTKKKS